MITVDLSFMDEDVTNYAFDQLEDRVYDKCDTAGLDPDYLGEYTYDYDEQVVEGQNDIVFDALFDALLEKLNDMERELNNGYEYGDVTEDDVRRMRSLLLSINV